MTGKTLFDPTVPFNFSAQTWNAMKEVVIRAGGDPDTMDTHRNVLELALRAGMTLKLTGYHSLDEIAVVKKKWSDISRLASKLYEVMQTLNEDDYILTQPCNETFAEPITYTRHSDYVLTIMLNSKKMGELVKSRKGDSTWGRDFVIRQFQIFWRDRLGLKVGKGRMNPELSQQNSGGNHAIAFALAGCHDLLDPPPTPDAILGVFRQKLPDADEYKMFLSAKSQRKKAEK